MKRIAIAAALAALAGCTQPSINPAEIGGAPARSTFALSLAEKKMTVTVSQSALSCVGTADIRDIDFGETRPMPVACSDGRTGVGTYTAEKAALNTVRFTLEDGTTGSASIGA